MSRRRTHSRSASRAAPSPLQSPAIKAKALSYFPQDIVASPKTPSLALLNSLIKETPSSTSKIGTIHESQEIQTEGVEESIEMDEDEIKETLENLKESIEGRDTNGAETDLLKKNLLRIGEYPHNLPLHASWTLYFSDTSSTSKRSTQGLVQYSSHIIPIFTSKDVYSLCGSLKALSARMPKSTMPPKRRNSMNKDSLAPPESGATHPEAAWTLGIQSLKIGQNLHFFRQPVQPLWEDKWNRAGGRLTLNPAAQIADILFLRILLLLAGSSLEYHAQALLSDPDWVPPIPPTPGRKAKGGKEGSGGMIMGVVANRRERGDRIEIWLGGKTEGEPPEMDWVERIKECLVRAGIKEGRSVKYKKHLT